MKRFATLVVVLLLVLGATTVFAQDTAPVPTTEDNYGLAPVAFDAYVVDLPSDWLVWDHGDYAIPALAKNALKDLISGLRPDLDLSEMTVEGLLLYAASPDLVNDRMVRLTVDTLSLSDTAEQIQADPSEITAMGGLQVYGVEPIAPITVNGRDGALGYKAYQTETGGDTTYLELWGIYIFPETDAIVIVTIGFPPAYLDVSVTNIDLITAMVISVRLPDEPFDEATFLSLQTPPAEATPEATPEATQAP
jgi:hypothetical protein